MTPSVGIKQQLDTGLATFIFPAIMTQFSSPEDHRHVLAVAVQAWGHARPLSALVARIVKARPLITVTFLVPSLVHNRMVKELSRHFDDSELNASARVRLIALQHNEQDFFDTDLLNDSFARTYNALVEGRPITCAKAGRGFTPIAAPDTAIFDLFAKNMCNILRKRSTTKLVKVYCWVVGNIGALHLGWGPSSPNKDRNLHALVQEEMEHSGKPLPEAAHKIMFPASDRVVTIPGIPPMYEYEGHPQETQFSGPLVALMHMAGAEMINACDGIIAATPECFEPEETLKDFCQWFTKSGQQIYLVGPMLPDTNHARELEKKQSAKSQEIDEFMDRVLKKYGAKSLIYISFGSVFWSTEPEKIWVFVDVLLERKVPFIFSHASPFAQIPDEVQEKVKSSGLGLFSPWSPQQAILQHAATAWFVTHCGYNSVMESIHFGVPMICWPYQADQPINVAIVTTKHDVAYELLEIRTGLGLKPLYRSGTAPTGTPEAIRKETNDILNQAFGEDGKKKRANVEKLRDAIAASWVEGGSCHIALERMLNGF